MKKFAPTPLSPGDRQALTVLTYQQGFKVLQHLMEVRVQQATVQMLSVAPDDPQRVQKISDLQAQAFARNSFCEELMNEIDWQVKSELAEQEATAAPEMDTANQALLNAALRMGIFTQSEEN